MENKLKMMMNRDKLLNKIIEKRNNGFVKLLYGVRRAGKTVLMSELLTEKIKQIDADARIIYFSFEDMNNADLRDSHSFLSFLNDQKTVSERTVVLLLDEVFLLDDPFALIDFFLKEKRFDVFLSTSFEPDCRTLKESRIYNRLDKIYISPLAPQEIYPDGNAFDLGAYAEYGGLPMAVTKSDDSERRNYLDKLIDAVYLPDIIRRNPSCKKWTAMRLLKLLSENVGEFLNSTILSSLYEDKFEQRIDPKTVETYLGYLSKGYLIRKVSKIDLKNSKEVGGKFKFYFSDLGIKNAVSRFESHFDSSLYENLLEIALENSGFDVNVGYGYTFYTNEFGKRSRLPIYVDFVAMREGVSYYLQSCFSWFDKKDNQTKKNALTKTPNSFKKILVYNERIASSYDSDGVLSISVTDFIENLDKILS